jgi:hypothetical protein
VLKNITCESSIELSQKRIIAPSNAEPNMTEGSNIMRTSPSENATHSSIDVDEILSGFNDYGLMNGSPAQMQNQQKGTAIGDDLRVFFEHIMVPELQSIHGEYLQPPPDLTAWMPEVEHFGELDLFGSSFVPSMDQVFDPQFGSQHIDGTPGSFNASDTIQAINDAGQESTTQRKDGSIRNPPWCVNYKNSHDMTLTGVLQAISHSESARSDRAWELNHRRRDHRPGFIASPTIRL